MRIFSLIFLPMLTFAVIVIIAGEKLSRNEVEETIPLNRKNILDFSELFEDEIERLDNLYINHLDQLSNKYFEKKQIEHFLIAQKNDINALKAIYLFSEKKCLRFSEYRKPTHNIRYPNIGIEGQETPLNITKPVLIPFKEFATIPDGESGWLFSSDKQYLVYWIKINPLHIVASLIDKNELNSTIFRHLDTWIKEPITPLIESDTHFAITSPIGQLVNSGNKESRGSAALIIPRRKLSATWQIKAWNGISTRQLRDNTTLTITSLIAFAFILSGYLLYRQQIQSLKLATQRVSFVNQVSHELGSPLTNISLNLDLATDALESPEIDYKIAQHRLNIVGQEVGRLNRLVSNVLTFSMSDRGILEINKEKCCPDKVISQLLDSYRPALQRRGIEVSYKPTVKTQISTDPDALTQIISNLISNIEKYASSGKWMSIKTELLQDAFITTVSDKGVGIPDVAAKRIFKPFERVESSLNEGSSGAGLGLSIASELAIKLGGSLEIIPCEIGCSFQLSIPIS